MTTASSPLPVPSIVSRHRTVPGPPRLYPQISILSVRRLEYTAALRVRERTDPESSSAWISDFDALINRSGPILGSTYR